MSHERISETNKNSQSKKAFNSSAVSDAMSANDPAAAGLPNLSRTFNGQQVAAQISRSASTATSAVDCIRFVLDHLSSVRCIPQIADILRVSKYCSSFDHLLQCQRADQVLPLLELLFRLSLLPNIFIPHALQRLQQEVLKVAM